LRIIGTAPGVPTAVIAAADVCTSSARAECKKGAAEVAIPAIPTPPINVRLVHLLMAD
jgi:hypothetical protein